MTAWRRIQRTQDDELTLGKLIIFFTPKSVLNLYLDAKRFRIQRKPYSLYVALDEDKQPLSIILLPRYELKDGYDIILQHLKVKKCRVYGIVSDWHPGIRASVVSHYPKAIHQRCAAHILQEVLRKIGGVRFLRTGDGRMIWSKLRKIALGFKQEKYARMYLGKMRKKYPLLQRGYRTFDKSLEDIYQFAKGKKPILRTSNYIENFMGILEQRLKTFRGMKTPETLIKIIASFVKIKYGKPTKK